MLIATMVCCALSLGWAEDSDAEVVNSGTCGPNLTWEFGDIGDLTIDGTGPMDFSGSSGEPPWKDCMGWITTVIIKEGVTSIEDNAFIGATSIFEVINLSDLDIRAGSEANGYVAYYANNVFQSEDDATVEVLDDVFIYGYSEGYAFLIKYIGSSDIVDLPYNLESGSYVICSYFYTSEDLTSLSVPNDILYVQEGAFGDLEFYDEDGETKLDVTADNLKGSTFNNEDGKLIKQQREDSPGHREMSPVVAYIAGLLSVGLIIYVIRRN